MTPRQTEYQEKALQLLIDAQEMLENTKGLRTSMYIQVFGKLSQYEAELAKWEYIVSRLKKWYAKIYLEQVKEMVEYLGITADVRDEMDTDMVEGQMPQGEIESCLNHWSNTYLIIKK